jgi:3-mercaptopyruvate sulfurtransferase SseA
MAQQTPYEWYNQQMVNKQERERMTAVEWLNQQLVDKQNGKGDSRSWNEILQQAKAMEKEQITDAVIFGVEQLSDSGDLENENRAEQYYNELYQPHQDKADK